MSYLFPWWPLLHFHVFLPPWIDYDMVFDFGYFDQLLSYMSPFFAVVVLLAVVSMIFRLSGRFGAIRK